MGDNDNYTHFTNMPITQWAEEDRPREKMLLLGKKSLTDSELLAILLRTGVKGCSAIDLAKQILQRHDNRLTEIARLEASDLQKDKGLGMAKAVTILAALELGNRMLKENNETADKIIRNSTDTFNYVANKIIDLPHEEFWAIYVNQRNKILAMQRISTGGITDTIVDVRLVFKGAIEHNAVAVAVAHNHPSGNLNPSRPDKELTQRLVEAGKVLNIKLLDHLVVGIRPSGKPDYFSFAENDLL